MNLCFNRAIIESYTSSSQQIRILTEDWVKKNGYCPNCGASLHQHVNNTPAADFYCGDCREQYELKSKKDSMGKKIVDGAYAAMIRRLSESDNPNFFLLNYELHTYQVLNFFVIPKHFFVSDIIEKRAPLSMRARRAGWIGCNILLQRIPHSGRIFLVKNSQTEPKQNVLNNWRRTLFLREEKRIESKGWLLDVMRCIEQIQKRGFSLSDVYAFEAVLAGQHPGNRHVKDKIRQQLQILRDRSYLQFTGRGEYCLS